jgi:hypothetical protein
MWEALKSLLSIVALMALCMAGYCFVTGNVDLLHAVLIGMLSLGICAKIDDIDREHVVDRWAQVGGADAGQMSRMRRTVQMLCTLSACVFFGFVVVLGEHNLHINAMWGVGYGVYIFAVYYGYMYFFDRARFDGRIALDVIIRKPLDKLERALDSFERNDRDNRAWLERQGATANATIAANHTDQYRSSRFAYLADIESSLNVVIQLLQLPAAQALSERYAMMARDYAQRAVTAFESAAAYDRNTVETFQQTAENIRRRFPAQMDLNG